MNVQKIPALLRLCSCLGPCITTSYLCLFTDSLVYLSQSIYFVLTGVFPPSVKNWDLKVFSSHHLSERSLIQMSTCPTHSGYFSLVSCLSSQLLTEEYKAGQRGNTRYMLRLKNFAICWVCGQETYKFKHGNKSE